MPRRSGSSVPRRSTAPALKPGLPHHNLPEPYASLQSAGWDEALDIYLKIGDMAGADEAHEIVERLTAMALDSTYYEYGDPASEKTRDPRTYAPLQAIRALCYVPEDAARVMKRLIPLFDTEDDALREELPFLFAAMGYQAYDELVAVTLDTKANIAYRDGAAESLVEMVEDIPDLEPQVVKVLERALAACKDSELAGYFVLDLMDLGNETSLTVIEQAFKDGRVDEEIATLEQAKEHFAGLAEPADSAEAAEEAGNRNDEGIIDGSDDSDLIGEIQETIGAAAYENAPAQQPYVAGPTPGRNDPCPCGSGKKYKKCCGMDRPNRGSSAIS